MTTLDQLQPYMPLIIMALVGLVAGTLASLLLGGGGLIRNLLVGVIGSFVGGLLVHAGWLNLPPSVTNITGAVPYGTQVLISTIGALIVVIVARFLGGR
jgi:uncharacterized membrane protein YeaQ/YmgE (transglycosylase-associated protein family)